ncbi:zinc finger matrin-type protein 5 isoform X3 [Eubalaena glacialis]|uniref:zinc finger matrin-type protein 5 isoform X3 n=1 Tax=Eubalaena glacialis TaxID=27606 RepID=UPI002A5ACAA1|nr:zinc finger matrin-type protein 5 isoform X3 [Eubalaena glacialis]
MGKRYFCDYCDRSFQDNLHNRKKHLNGLQHLKAKKLWYDMFRDAAAILLDEQNKRPCRKFLLTEERRATEWPLDVTELPEVHVDDWLEKRAQRLSSAPSSRAEPIRATVFQYPVGWPPVQELPPSLRAPPPGGWPLQPSVQWG